MSQQSASQFPQRLLLLRYLAAALDAGALLHLSLQGPAERLDFLLNGGLFMPVTTRQSWGHLIDPGTGILLISRLSSVLRAAITFPVVI